MKKLLTLFLLISYQVFAQNPPPLERIISLKISNERLDNTLKSISSAGNFSFSYNPSEISIEKRVSFNAQNQSVREILSELLGNATTFKNRGNNVILKKINQEAQKDFFVMGYVSDGETGLKIEKASIYEPVTLASTVSNEYGFYRLKISRDINNINLLVRKQNYQDERILVRTKQDKNLNIKLLAINSSIKIEPIIRLISFKIDSLPNPKLDSLPIVQPAISKIESIETNDSVIVKTPRIDYQAQWAATKEKVLSGQQRFTDWFIRTKQNIHLDNIRDTIYRPFQLSLLPFIGTNHYLSGNVINNVSINILGGYSLGVRNVEVGGFLNIVRGKVNGLQASGFGNLVVQDVKGVQLAAFGSIVGRNFQGVQASGFGNFNGGNAKGIQAAGFGNIVFKSSTGLQAAGFGNFVWQDSPASVQVAGFGNTTIGSGSGVQSAGFGNFVGKNYKGIQVSGTLNFVGGTMTGLQVSTVNFARKAKNNVQIGVINFAGESSNNVPIGLLSFAGKGGYKRLEIAADEVNLMNFTLKTGVKRFYNILTAGYSFGQTNKPNFSLGYGLGTAWQLNRILGLNLDFVSSHIQQNTSDWTLNQLTKASLGLEIRAARHFAFFIAPTFNFLASDASNNDLGKSFGWKTTQKQSNYFGQSVNNSTWIGLQGGIRIF